MCTIRCEYRSAPREEKKNAFHFSRARMAKPPWVYSRTPDTASNADDQRDTWPNQCSSGSRQSPINIIRADAIPTPALDGAVSVHISKHVPLLVNSGHNFQLDETSPVHSVHEPGDSAPHATATFKGWSHILGGSYNFYQVHWHSPSENTIDGSGFAMEAHYVHQLNDSSLVGTNAKLAVIAVMYELRQDTCNPELDRFWNQLPLTPGNAPFDTPIDIGSWLGNDMLSAGYYAWKGSLTTPPCTEGVTWVLLRSTSFVCPRQVERLRTSLRLSQSGVEINNRAVQPTNGRRVQVTTSPRLLEPAPATSLGLLRASRVWAPLVMAALAAALLLLAAWKLLPRPRRISQLLQPPQSPHPSQGLTARDRECRPAAWASSPPSSEWLSDDSQPAAEREGEDHGVALVDVKRA